MDRDEDEFSMSSYDGDQSDSLVIKPPQAVVMRKEKRDKRDRRDRHKHKVEKHKEKQKSRERRRHEEEKREHRRHRELSKSKRDGRKHRTKHEYEGGQIKHDKPRIIEKEIRKRGDKMHPRDHENKHHSHGKDRSRHDDGYSESSISNQDRMERDRRMQRFLQAEKQEEISQKEIESRRKRRQDEIDMETEILNIKAKPFHLKETRRPNFSHHHRRKNGHSPSPEHHEGRKQRGMSQREIDDSRRRQDKMELEVEVLRQKAKASMIRKTRKISLSPHSRKKMRPELETVEIISDDEHDRDFHNSPQEEIKAPEREEEEPEKEEEKDNIKENLSDVSSSEESSSSEDSDSSSSSSSEDEDDDDEEGNESDKSSKNDSKASADRKRPRANSASATGSDSETSSSEMDTSEDKDKSKNDIVKSDHEEDLPVYYPAIMGCRSVDEFECLNRIEEGTYGVVYRAREKATNTIVALKRLKMEKEKEGFPITSLREVNTLLKGQHENIVTVREIVVGSNMDKIYIVMDYVEHDLKSLMEMMRQKNSSFTIGEVKTLLMQLLQAVHHLHDNWILHRDLKTSNLLLSHKGILKVGDFGLAREYGSPLKQYTPIVVTLWYRAPELLLGTKLYSTAIDVWSVGCIFGELLSMEPMFPGKSDIDELNKIFKTLGSPSERIWPGYNDFPVVKKTQFADYPYNQLREKFKEQLSDEGFNLLNQFLTYNPEKRISCFDAFKHNYFVSEAPAPVPPEMFPTWPAKSEMAQGSKKISSPKPPSGGQKFKELHTADEESIAGFFLGGAAPSGPGFTLKF